MIRATTARAALASVPLLLALGGCDRALDEAFDRGVVPATTPAGDPVSADPAVHAGLLYGRVTMEDGAVYQGRLRWGGDEEALWSHYFNGFKSENPWAGYRPRPSVDVFGIAVPGLRVTGDLGRPFMARFGDLARIEARGRDLQVTLKSGTVFDLDRFAADDLADGLRVWDDVGVVDIGEWKVRSLEFLPAPRAGNGPAALHGTVRTRHGVFTGLVQWDREAGLVTDELEGRSVEGGVRIPFGRLTSIARHSAESSLVTLRDGREMVLSDTREVGPGNRGLYVDDPRYGRVLVSWDAFLRVDFSEGGIGPAYDDFAAGRQLAGIVTTRGGRRMVGRLVFDLDESETTETLDAPAQGVDYTLPFGRIASIVPSVREDRVPRRARVTLHGGEELYLEPSGDLGEGNAGLLVFTGGAERPEYVAWADVEEITFVPTGP